MKYLKIAGLCLVSTFVVGIAMASTASAANVVVWEGCLEGSNVTKYTSKTCQTLGTGTKEWGWKEIKNTDYALGVGFTFSMTDTKVPIIGSTSIICTEGGRAEGTDGPGEFGRIEVAEIQRASTDCRGTGGCKAAGVKAIAAINLPWQTKLSEEKGRLLATTENGGNGEPGWEVECENILGGTTKDICKSEGAEKLEHAILTNVQSPDFTHPTESVKLVLAVAAKSRVQDCTEGGTESGVIAGSGAILLANAKFETDAQGLRVN